MARERRERGDGTIFYGASRKRWAAQVDLGVDAAGSRVRPTVYGATPDKVKRKLDDLREAHRKGADLTARGTTFDEIATAWLQRDLGDRVSASTRATYEALLRSQISSAIGHRKVVDLRAEDVEDMLLDMQEAGRPARYMRLTLNLTSRVLDYAMRRDIVLRNVADHVRAPAGPTAERYGLTVEQARHLLEVAAGYRLGNLVTLSLMLGLRPGEAAGLTWENVVTKGERQRSPSRPACGAPQ